MSKQDSTALSRTLASTETLQIAELHALDAYGTPIEERFELITRLSRRALRLPVVAVTAVTQNTQWFKSVLGWSVCEMPLSESLCEQTVKRQQPVVLPNLADNPRYSSHPLVCNDPGFRFYAGVPLVNVKGTTIGTLCAMDFKARKISRSDYQTLMDLGSLAQRELMTVALHTAQTALVSKLSVARRQALLDPLTRTWNRRGGTMLIEESLKRAEREKQNVAILAVDLDKFKNVNDSYGHVVGDRALCMVARELLACVRDNDGVCRFGGDEFFVVIVGCERNDADAIADRVRKKIEQNTIPVRNGHAAISVSIGIRFVKAGETPDPDELLADADRALYEDKLKCELAI